MIVFRLSKSKYANDLSGNGAAISGGRWNSRGVAMIYTSDSRALCVTEIAVHTPLGNIPRDYKMIIFEISDHNILELDSSKLPKGWNSFPFSVTLKAIGDQFIQENKSMVLKVPSAVVQGDFNYLINPGHSNFKKLIILGVETFNFDKRLF